MKQFLVKRSSNAIIISFRIYSFAVLALACNWFLNTGQSDAFIAIGLAGLLSIFSEKAKEWAKIILESKPRIYNAVTLEIKHSAREYLGAEAVLF